MKIVMNKVLKSALSFVFIGTLSTGIKADFFAYQEWVNPKTGQVLKEYYDLHKSSDPKIMAQQQEDFMAEAQRHGDSALCLIEDFESRNKSQFWDKITSEMKKCLKIMGEMKKNDTVKKVPLVQQIVAATPISGLYNKCKAKGISAINVECRNLSELMTNSDIEQELPGWNDGPDLNAYYKSLLSCADKTVEENPLLNIARIILSLHLALNPIPDRQIESGPVSLSIKINAEKLGSFINTVLLKGFTGFIRGAFLVDAKILHALYTNPDKKYVSVAAGALHIADVNIMLAKLGWVPKTPVMNASLIDEGTKAIAHLFLHAQDSIVETSTLETTHNALKGIWTKWFTHVISTVGKAAKSSDILVSHPLDINAIMGGHLRGVIAQQTAKALASADCCV